MLRLPTLGRVCCERENFGYRRLLILISQPVWLVVGRWFAITVDERCWERRHYDSSDL